MYLKQPDAFYQTVIRWHEAHGRKQLPWQTNPTPYRVWVSEIMLQQTQVATVRPYYQRWMQRFPDVFALARASEDDVMAVWQGLGYYSRARNLRKGARYLVDHFDGQFPTNLSDIRSIPGIGPYTAGAVMSFAYNESAALVDGNVKRLFCRLFGIEGQPNQSTVNRRIWLHAEALLPPDRGREYAQGLLDLGATVCKLKNPACDHCPLHAKCHAFTHQCVSELPTPKLKTSKPRRQGSFLWTESAGRILLEKRDRHVWTGLWCLPEIGTQPSKSSTVVGSFRHQFTHYQLDAVVVLDSPCRLEDHWRWFELHELQQIGLPTPIRAFIQKHLKRTAA